MIKGHTQNNIKKLMIIINFLMTYIICNNKLKITISRKELPIVNTKAINKMKSRSKAIFWIMRFLTWGIGILLLVSIGLITWASFLPQDMFEATKGISHWSLSIAISEQGSFSVTVPFTILQGLNTDMFQAKAAFLTFTLVSILTFLLVFLYGVIQVKNILWSITEAYTPFTSQNAIRLRNLAFIIIGYSLLGNLIVNMAMVIFVTNIFIINLVNISISGLIIGSLLLIISQIFRYGAYLQKEYDTTL